MMVTVVISKRQFGTENGCPQAELTTVGLKNVFEIFFFFNKHKVEIIIGNEKKWP